MVVNRTFAYPTIRPTGGKPDDALRYLLTLTTIPTSASTITFNIARVGGSTGILLEPLTELPTIIGQTSIQGQMYAGGKSAIQIEGDKLGPNSIGIHFNRSTPGNTAQAVVSGLTFESFSGPGILIEGDGHQTVQGFVVDSCGSGIPD